MKRCLDEETPESISKPIKENTTPKEIVDIINDFRKEEKYQEIIQTSLINNGHIEIYGTEEGKAMHKYFHYLDAKNKEGCLLMKEMNDTVYKYAKVLASSWLERQGKNEVIPVIIAQRAASNEESKTCFLPSFIPSFSTCVFCGVSDNLAEQLS
ncbi:hypothetical protein C1646_819010 [Rhizophagus diaphanus]|nr:hypothetical protein C1646_819010 [Rhizophagus diaphanus] [Rhizophagus sp. MUCL 43196]